MKKSEGAVILPVIVNQSRKQLDIMRPLSTVKHTYAESPLSEELKSHAYVYSSPPMAAGVPVLELIRKLEDEKMLSRSDRSVVNDILNDLQERDLILKIFRDIELATDRILAIKKLRSAMSKYKNLDQFRNDGLNIVISSNQPVISMEVSPIAASSYSVSPTKITKAKLKKPNDDLNTSAYSLQSIVSDTKATLSKVLSEKPVYGGPGGAHVCLKIARRLKEFLSKYDPSKMGTKRFCVIVGSGSFNPLTRMHLRKYFIAKQFIESKTDMIVLGSLLSPSHISVVRQRYRTCPSEIIPCPHRLAIAQFCVQDTKWMSIDPWEITRRRSMDYLSLLEHVNKMLKSFFPAVDIRVLYLCKGGIVPLLSVPSMKASNFGCVSVCRAPESDNLRLSLGSRWNGMIYIAEDTAILDAAMDSFSSKKVREKLKNGLSVDNLVGDTVAGYLNFHRIGQKVCIFFSKK
jgi:nicotinic acid mononucleotide adenylyltransferase